MWRAVAHESSRPPSPPVGVPVTRNESWVPHDLSLAGTTLVFGWSNDQPASAGALAMNCSIELARHSTEHESFASRSQ
jgi:hypothetical protein